MTELVIKQTIDARGSMCPGPLMELVRVIKEVEVGDIIDLLTSDKGSEKDIPAWLDKAGHELVEIKNEDGFQHILVKKGEKKERRRRRGE